MQITVAETLGVEQPRPATTKRPARCATWSQNHMIQLFSLVAMEPPVAFDADAVRDEKVKVLRAVRPITPQT